MRHLVIAAHPNTKSFNHSVVKAYARALRTIYDEALMQFTGMELVKHLYLSGIQPGMSRAEGEEHLANVRRFVGQTF